MAHSGHYRALDSFRAIGCVLVAYAHWPSGGLLSSGHVATTGILVDFFFVLSGFVIGASYTTRIVDGQSAMRFAWLRIGRIYPLHLATLTAMVVFEFISLAASYAATGGPDDSFTGIRAPSAILPNITLTQIFGPRDGTWNGPSWSIAAEMWTYFIFAALTAWSGRFRYIAYAAAIVLSWFVIVRWSAAGLYDTAHLSVFRASIGFFIGIFVWKISEWIAGLPAPRQPSRRVWTLLEAAALAAPVYFTFFAGEKDPISFAAPLFVAAFVLVFAIERGRISAILQHPALVGLGALSFSFYLIHRPMIMVASGLLKGVHAVAGVSTMHAGADGWPRFGADAFIGDLLFIPFVGAVFAVSWLSFRYLEEPCRATFRRMRVGRSAARPQREAPATIDVVPSGS